jgi:hypothetical protein
LVQPATAGTPPSHPGTAVTAARRVAAPPRSRPAAPTRT